MPDDVAIAAQIPAELDDALARLAAARGETKAELVLEALQHYVRSEDDFVAAVAEGLADVRAGRLRDHDDVMRDINALLAQKR
ncbi:MAG: ribbon-helix-helix protein, CopG family [Alphaproteobacteria bacterium]|nr:ribbon-helix-helix protein, CopG family [Alphaproteobacteria bacterium]